MNTVTAKRFSSSDLDGKEPSDILSREEFKKVASHIPPSILFNTLSFKYYNQLNVNVLPGADLYIEVMRKLDNDNQRYLVFLWSIGVCILIWNNAILEHERAPELRWISDEDWKKAHDGILTLATSGAF